jgi:LPPG:FO 2-phospho-L-lactate transferase
VKVVALSGGVGGARLVDGLAAVLAPDELTVVVNTGDDFDHWGLRICPDLDTVMYTLAGLGDRQRGWGLEGESFAVLEAVQRLGGEHWFALGDRDLATHLVRTERLAQGQPLSQVTAELCVALGVRHRVLPMAEGLCATLIETARGVLSFQDWLVRERGVPRVTGVRFPGSCGPAVQVIRALDEADLIVITPSNPFVSVDPILALSGVRAAMTGKPVVAVSPIVHGRAVKGPLAGMLASLAGVEPSAAAVAEHYGNLVQGWVVETGDGAGMHGPVVETETVMGDRSDRARLAREVLALGADRISL